MRRSRLLMSLTVLCGWALACGGLDDAVEVASSSGGDYYVTAELTEPWSGMGLPIDGGNVFVSSSTSATFQYSAGSVDEHFARFRQHFEGSGYEVFIEDLDGQTYTVIYKKGDAQIVLTGIDVAGMATISVTDSGA